MQDGRVQAHGIPVAPVTGQRPGLTETFATHWTPERFFLDVYVPAHTCISILMYYINQYGGGVVYRNEEEYKFNFKRRPL